MLRPRLLHLEHKLICTVHDSIVIDTPKENVEEIVTIVNQVFKELPAMINRIFNCGWDLEVKVEIKIGMNLSDMEEV